MPCTARRSGTVCGGGGWRYSTSIEHELRKVPVNCCKVGTGLCPFNRRTLSESGEFLSIGSHNRLLALPRQLCSESRALGRGPEAGQSSRFLSTWTIPLALLGCSELRSIPERKIPFFLHQPPFAGFGFNPVIIHTTCCTDVQRIFAFFGVITAAAREINWRQAIHVAFAVVISGTGRGSTRTPVAFTCRTWGLGGVDRMVISFWRKGLGGRRLVRSLYLCNTEHSEEWYGTYRRHRFFFLW